MKPAQRVVETKQPGWNSTSLSHCLQYPRAPGPHPEKVVRPQKPSQEVVGALDILEQPELFLVVWV